MIKPRTIHPENDPATGGTERPTCRMPKPDTNFGGWGPRLRY